MAKIKLTKSTVDAAKVQAQALELVDTLVSGFLCKVTPAGRKVFLLQYRLANFKALLQQHAPPRRLQTTDLTCALH